MDLATIQKRLDLMDKYIQEIKTAKEMLQGELENSPEYVEATEEAKEIANKRKRIREDVMNTGGNKKLAEDIKQNQEEIKTLREILSAELFAFYKENNSDIITDANGELRKFKIGAKLLPKKSSYDDRDSEGKYVPQAQPAE